MAFPPGLIDAIIAQLPHEIRIIMFLNLARQFAINGPDHPSNIGLVEVIESITKLDLSHYLGINEETFCNLVHIPFSSALAHLNLSKTPIGKSQACKDTLSNEIFKHLVTLDLSYTQLYDIAPLLNAPHQFPKLHTLNLSFNDGLSIPQLATTTQFPNLKVLDLGSTYATKTLAAFSAFNNLPQPQPPLSPSTPLSSATSATTTSTSSSTTTTTSPTPAPLSPQFSPFQLEKLVLSRTFDQPSLIALSRSPHVSQLKELHINPHQPNVDTIRQLFDPERSMLRNLTHLNIKSDPFALRALGESPLLSNLNSFVLHVDFPPMTFPSDPIELREQSLQQFLHSPFLWSSKLKHLSLRNYPTQFDHVIPILDKANIKLETLNLISTHLTFDRLLTSSCVSELKDFQVDAHTPQFTPEQFLQLPFLSNLERFPFPLSEMDHDDLLTILSSPQMSNNLTELDFFECQYPMKDVIKTICTTHVDPDDETSPLKYGKLRKLKFDEIQTDVDDDDLKLIVENLTELTHLELGYSYDEANLTTDETITTLVATERSADPVYHPHISLPNLTHLNLSYSGITCEGLVALSKSQLFSQLEELKVSYCEAECWDEGDPELPPGLLALLTNSHISCLKSLSLTGLMPDHIALEELKDDYPEIAKYFQHLGNYCQIETHEDM